MQVRTCIKCKASVTVNCTDEQYETYTKGKLIQHAMPDVSADEREMLISGICASCWDKMFKSGEC